MTLRSDTEIEMTTTHDEVETLGEDIAALVAERQSLRVAGAAAEPLEANRVAICGLQRRLAQALIARHLPEQQAA